MKLAAMPKMPHFQINKFYCNLGVHVYVLGGAGLAVAAGTSVKFTG